MHRCKETVEIFIGHISTHDSELIAQALRCFGAMVVIFIAKLGIGFHAMCRKNKIGCVRPVGSVGPPEIVEAVCA
jgi:hypothetical protein|tara:strand:+ start:208 stop:432 length:225 start_codon:yes stop_codon:yes gene_type:complete